MDISLDDAGLADSEVSYHKNLVETLLVVVVLHGERGGRELSMNPACGEGRGTSGVRRRAARREVEREEGSSCTPWPTREGGAEASGPRDSGGVVNSISQVLKRPPPMILLYKREVPVKTLEIKRKHSKRR